MLLEQSTVIAYSPLKLVLETNNDTTPHDQKEPNQPNKQTKKKPKTKTFCLHIDKKIELFTRFHAEKK